jgi:MYXO-CTERM domain-containing protein
VADQSTDDSTQPGDVTLTDADAQQPLEDGPGIPNEGGATLPDTGGGHGQSRSLEGGCGCELGARASSTSLALVLLFGLVVVLRRRRLKK